VQELLLSDDAAFVVVTAPEPGPTEEAVMLAERLREDAYPLLGVVLNRVHGAPPAADPSPSELSAVLARAGARHPDDLAARAAETLAEHRVLARHDSLAREALAESLGSPLVGQVPALPDEPVDLHGLARVTAALRT
jgi:Mrp family chromosome partitioning ATPase